MKIEMPEMLEKSQCIGYMIMSAKRLGLDQKTIKDLKRIMQVNMDIYTAEFADSEYDNF